MRAVLVSLLMVSVIFAGCTSSTSASTDSNAEDIYGNEYTWIAKTGTAPFDGSVLAGASAMSLRPAADNLARAWSEDATLFTVIGWEIPEGGSYRKAFAGPQPARYTVYDRFPGDGLMPTWNFLYMAPSKSGETCRMLFVHTVSNGFASAYEFDPSAADFEDEDRTQFWRCGDETLAGATPDWRVDSNKASSKIRVTDNRFQGEASSAAGILWVIDPASRRGPEPGGEFGAHWFVLAMSDLSNPLRPQDFLVCSTTAGNPTIDNECYDEDGVSTYEVEGNAIAEGALEPESGSGVIQFGFVFSGPQTARFQVASTGHPRLVLDFTLPAETPYESVMLELRNPEAATVDSANYTKEPATQTGQLVAEDPASGRWSLRVTGDAGTPRVQYRWCAYGYDPATDQEISCS